MNRLRLLISVVLLFGIVLLPASAEHKIGPPGSGVPSPSGTSSGNIQITTSRTYSGSSFSTFGGASATPSKSVQMTKANEIPIPMAPPALDPQEIASATSTRLIGNPGIQTSNMFYVSKYPLTVSSCSLGDEVPILFDLKNIGHLYSYEWYPDGELHTNEIGDIAYSGTQERSFYGDSPGLHTLQYFWNMLNIVWI